MLLPPGVPGVWSRDRARDGHSVEGWGVSLPRILGVVPGNPALIHLSEIPKTPQRSRDGSGAAEPGKSGMEKSSERRETAGKSAQHGAHPALSHDSLLGKGEKVGISGKGGQAAPCLTTERGK